MDKKMGNRKKGKSVGGQDAMEFLMTYGWALLIIAVIFIVFFQLDLFKGASFSPKQQPGGCQVVRPLGTQTSTFASLQGNCNGDFPAYIATFGNSIQYEVTINQTFFQDNSFTILAWMYWLYTTIGTNYDKDIGYAWSGANTLQDEGFGLFVRDSNAYTPAAAINSICASTISSNTPCWYLNFYSDDLECGYGPQQGHWYQFGASWNNLTRTQTIWVNGAANCSATSTGYLNTNGPLVLGSAAGTWNNGAYMYGAISNVQLYNNSLTPLEIKSLYLEGIGGPPLDLQNLRGWWPLNYNTNDYSGNGYNGQLYNSSYSGLWSSTYTPP